MYLKSRDNGDLVEVLDTAPLFDPFQSEVPGRMHAGEEMQDTRSYPKSALVFPSGEALPRCWTDGDYRVA